MDKFLDNSARTTEHITPTWPAPDVRANETGDVDLKCIAYLSHAAYAMLLVAIDIADSPGHQFDRSTALRSLRRNALDGPFHLTYVCRIALKVVDPRGHGVNGSRFQGVELAAFRFRHPELSRLTDAMAMFLVACQRWIQINGNIASQHPGGPVSTANLHDILGRLGFLKREREALVRIVTWRCKNWGE